MRLSLSYHVTATAPVTLGPSGTGVPMTNSSLGSRPPVPTEVFLVMAASSSSPFTMAATRTPSGAMLRALTAPPNGSWTAMGSRQLVEGSTQTPLDDVVIHRFCCPSQLTEVIPAPDHRATGAPLRPTCQMETWFLLGETPAT